MKYAEKMKAVRIAEHGGPEVLRWGEAVKPQPREGEILVRVRASAINARDSLVRSGKYSPAKALPLIMGEEAAGTIETDTTQFRLGEPVIVHDAGMGSLRDGAWAEYVAVPMQSVRPMPRELTFEQAAGLASAGVTALGALRVLKVKSGQSLLVLGATGGVGSAAVQVAKAEGIIVIAEVSTPAKAERLKDLGADHIVTLSDGPLEQQVRALTGGRGVDAVLDPIGGDVTGRAVAALAEFGRLAHLGSAAGEVLSIRSSDLIRNAVKIIGFNRFKVSPDGYAQDLHEVVQLAARGRYRTALDRTFPIEQIAEATRHFEEGRGVGKVVLTMPPAEKSA
jgi:NADPH2:quinone reductase